MIKQSEITHGALFAIPLWHDLGYFYGKMLFCSSIDNTYCHPKEVFLKVYDHYTVNCVNDFDQHFFKYKELFVDIFILSGFPKLKGVNSWKFLRHDPIYEGDSFIPHYWEPGMLGELNIPEEKIFRVVKYGNLKNIDDCYFPYYRIKHLPIYRLKSYDAISLYLTFDWLKRNGKDVDEPFAYKDGIDLKKSIRFEVTHYATDYRTIPKEIRGRVAPDKNDVN